MAYNINGRRLTYSEAIPMLITAIAAHGRVAFDTALDTAEFLLHSVTPGTRREYAALVISCYYKD